MMIRLFAYYHYYMGLLQKRIARSYYEYWASYTGGKAEC